MKHLLKQQKGEMILIILLVMAVGLTIGLSVASRSLTDIRLSTQIEESSRAFSAAEAGIESILKQGIFSASDIPSTPITGTNTTYNVSLSSLGNSASLFEFPSDISEGDAQTIWLVPQKEGGPDTEGTDYNSQQIAVCWKALSSAVAAPALEVSVLYIDTNGDYEIARNAYDPDNTARSGNGFTTSGISSPSTNCSGYDYEVMVDFATLDDALPITASDKLVALRLRPVYAGARLAVLPQGASLPEQGKNIVSTGQTASGVSRKWNVVQTYSAPHDIFDYALWSGTEISK